MMKPLTDMATFNQVDCPTYNQCKSLERRSFRWASTVKWLMMSEWISTPGLRFELESSSWLRNGFKLDRSPELIPFPASTRTTLTTSATRRPPAFTDRGLARRKPVASTKRQSSLDAVDDDDDDDDADDEGGKSHRRGLQLLLPVPGKWTYTFFCRLQFQKTVASKAR